MFPKEQPHACTHFSKLFEVFAIKTCFIVGHLPRKILRATKFILDPSVLILVKLIPTDYERSPLVWGGLEIAYKTSVKLPGQ